EGLPRRAAQGHINEPAGQAVLPKALRDLVAEHRADSAVSVAHLTVDECRSARFERLAGPRDEFDVEVLPESVVLAARVPQRLARLDACRGEHGGEVESLGLPVPDSVIHLEEVTAPDSLVERAEPECGEVLAHFLGEVLEEGLNELGLS